MCIVYIGWERTEKAPPGRRLHRKTGYKSPADCYRQCMLLSAAEGIQEASKKAPADADAWVREGILLL